MIMKHNNSVLLDTSFFIRLYNVDDPLHNNARTYFERFLTEKYTLKISTVSIAEYCVGGDIDDLPLLNMQIIPFNYSHAIRTGEFARILFEQRKITSEQLYPRAIIPNDSKLFAQADLDKTITHFVTSDNRSNTTYGFLAEKVELNFRILNIETDPNQFFGTLF